MRGYRLKSAYVHAHLCVRATYYQYAIESRTRVKDGVLAIAMPEALSLDAKGGQGLVHRHTSPLSSPLHAAKTTPSFRIRNHLGAS